MPHEKAMVTRYGSQSESLRRRVLSVCFMAAGWLFLYISMAMVVGYYVNSPFSPEVRPWSGLSLVAWSLAPVGVRGLAALFIPYYLGLASGTAAATFPTPLVSKWLIWTLRICSFGTCEALLVLLINKNNIPSSGALIFMGGGVLIGLSAWIRPAEHRKSDSGTSRQRAEPP